MLFIMVLNNTSCLERTVSFDEKNEQELLLEKSRFGLSRSVLVRFENTAGEIVAMCDTHSYFQKGTERRQSVVLKDGYSCKLIFGDNEKLQFVFRLSEPRFPCAGKIILDTKKRFTFGAASDDTVVCSENRLIAPHHLTLSFNGKRWTFACVDRKFCYLNGRKSQKGELHFGDTISVFGLVLVYFGRILAVSNLFVPFDINPSVRLYDTSLNEFAQAKQEYRVGAPFVSSARSLPRIDYGTMEIMAPPSLRETKQRSFLSAIGRPLTMAIPMVIGIGMMSVGFAGNGGFMSLGIITAVTSGLLGAGWATVSYHETDEDEFVYKKQRYESYAQYLMDAAKKLEAAYDKNRRALFLLNPSAGECTAYSKKDPRLWTRTGLHDDFLFVRLGVGNVPFQIELKMPKENIALQRDYLTDAMYALKSEYEWMTDVPVGVDLREKPSVGVVSSADRNAAIQIVRSMIVQLAANVRYTDLRIVLLNQRQHEKKYWSFVKDLPHVWSEDKQVRFYSETADDVAELCSSLNEVFQRRDASAEKEAQLPYYVVFVTDPLIIEDKQVKRFLLSPQRKHSCSVVFLADHFSALPNACTFLIRCTYQLCELRDLMDTSSEKILIQPDQVGLEAATQLSHVLAGIHISDDQHGAEIPDRLDFLSMFGTGNVQGLKIRERWENSRIIDSMAAPIGICAGNKLMNFDAHEKAHGPHGLVAGTTGSGKSETLQSMILSLAICYGPEEINFFIIDYKGGGLSNFFTGLPHLAGQVTNLSGNSVSRALISINSECERRQRIFRDHAVKDITQYAMLRSEGLVSVAIPHLLIVVDEFAELKKSEPEFMQGLTRVAQIGRSLGIHLILATQKPSGTVDDNIRSNAKFRLCLRVQDRQDSIDMIHKPDAAYITQPGRAVFQVGSDELSEVFQSAWSGAPYSGDASDEEGAAIIIGRTGKPVLPGIAARMREKESQRVATYAELLSRLLPCVPKNQSLQSLSYREISSLCDAFLDSQPEDSLILGERELLINLLKNLPEDYDRYSVTDIAKNVLETADKNGVRLPSVGQQTQLDAVLREIVRTNRAGKNYTAHQLWLPFLKKRIVLGDLEDWQKQIQNPGKQERFSFETVAGLVDDPVSRTQDPLYVDFAGGGHLAVVGSVASGKSTLMQTILYGLTRTYSPEQFNAYIIDFSSGMLRIFEQMPNVGGVITERTSEKIEKLFVLLDRMLKERKAAMSGSNFLDLAKNGRQQYPAVILAIDNFAGFRENTEDQYEGQLLQIAREGISCGIFLMVSGAGFGLREISSRVGEYTRAVLTLDLADRYKYADALHSSQIPIMPDSGIRGRGLVRMGDRCLEYQAAIVDLGVQDGDQQRAARLLAESCPAEWKDHPAVPIPEIPSTPTWSVLLADQGYQKSVAQQRLLPFGYDSRTADIIGMDLFHNYCMTILGQNETDVLDLMQLLALSAMQKPDAETVVIDLTGKKDRMPHISGVQKYVSDAEELFSFFKELTPVFVERNQKKHAVMDSGAYDDEIFAQMQAFRPIFIFIVDLQSFFTAVYTVDEKHGKMNGFVENIFEKGQLHNIFFFGSLMFSEAGVMNSYAAFRTFTQSGTGVLLNRQISAQKILSFGDLPYAATSKPPEKNTAYIATSDGSTNGLQTIVLPNVNR